MTAALQARRRAQRTETQAISRALSGLLATAVRGQPRDMSLTSLSTLATLELTGPRRITDLAAGEGLMQPSMTALVSALERSGLVERRRDPVDRRVVLVALTPGGTDYIHARRQVGVALFAQLIDDLPADEVNALAAAVSALKHIRQLDEQRRHRSSVSPPRSAGEALP